MVRSGESLGSLRLMFVFLIIFGLIELLTLEIQDVFRNGFQTFSRKGSFVVMVAHLVFFKVRYSLDLDPWLSQLVVSFVNEDYLIRIRTTILTVPHFID